MQILLYLCTRNKSTPWDCVFIGWEITDIIRRHKRFVFGYLESGKFSYIQQNAAF